MVRIVSPATSRASDYDRNPGAVAKSSDVNAGAAARVLTTDWSQTVTSKKFRVDIIEILVINDSATATNGNARGRILYTPNGQGAAVVLEARLATGQASGGPHISSGGPTYFYDGDVIAGQSESNNSAAGSSVYVRCTLKGATFDP